jgi:hypothetical protein
MILELVAIVVSGILAVVATGIMVKVVTSKRISRDVEVVFRRSGDKIRVSKSSDGVVRRIEIVNPSADVKNILDV